MCKNQFMDAECFKNGDCDMKCMCRMISNIHKDYEKAKRKEIEHGKEKRDNLALVG